MRTYLNTFKIRIGPMRITHININTYNLQHLPSCILFTLMFVPACLRVTVLVRSRSIRSR